MSVESLGFNDQLTYLSIVRRVLRIVGLLVFGPLVWIHRNGVEQRQASNKDGLLLS